MSVVCKNHYTMNKRLVCWGAAATIVVWLLLWAVLRLTWVGQSHNAFGLAIATILTLLGFPIRLYVVLFLGENGSWPLPLLALLLLISGVVWGLVLERGVALFSRTNRMERAAKI